jgi:hypothetical protein
MILDEFDMYLIAYVVGLLTGLLIGFKMFIDKDKTYKGADED